MSKKRILFVDDEPKVLRGIQRMMMTIQHDWEINFAESGDSALELMASEPYEVIISDMRMPGMTGSELLDEVKNKFPTTVRIALSGQVDNKDFIKSVGPIHQFLSKPCNAITLKSTIVRACALRSLLDNERLTRITSEMESLPSLPDYYKKLIEEIESSDASAKSVGKIVSQDMSMTAKLLQLVNSAFFGVARHISDPSQAVMILGMNVVRDLALMTHTFSQFKISQDRKYILDALWNHSIKVTGLSEKIARAENFGKEMLDEALTAGLLHDIGKLVLASKAQSDYDKILKEISRTGKSAYEVEYDIIGASHAEVGAYLLGLWGLSDSIVEAIAYHHDPMKSPGSKINCLTAVHVSNVFAMNSHKLEPTDEDLIDGVCMEYLEKLGLVDRLPVWLKTCREELLEDINNG